jgi:hypothetical protein
VHNLLTAQESNKEVQKNNEKDRDKDTCARCGYCSPTGVTGKNINEGGQLNQDDINVLESLNLSSSSIPDDLGMPFLFGERRDDDLFRKTTVCSDKFDIPHYRNCEAGKIANNIYSPWFGWKYDGPDQKDCYKFSYQYISQNTKPRTGQTFATEHVYELQLIDIFIRSLEENNVIQAYLTAMPGRSFCRDIFGALFKPPISYAPGFFFVGTTPMNLIGGRPIDSLTSRLSSQTRQVELMYLERKVNSAKQLWMSSKNWPSRLQYSVYERMVMVGALYKYLNEPLVRNVMCCVSRRMANVYRSVDTAMNMAIVANFNNGQFNGLQRFSFEAAYRAWERDLARGQRKWKDWMLADYTQAIGALDIALANPKLAKDKPKITMLKAKLMSERTLGSFSDAAMDWKYQTDIARPGGCSVTLLQPATCT